MSDADFFLNSPSGCLWKSLGVFRRAGVALPLFSVQSKRSVGVGELPDLELLAGWCVQAGLSIIQLLPMNDVGFDFRPYDSQSSIALEPMHLSLEKIAFVPVKNFQPSIRTLREKFPLDSFWYDTAVKKEKLALFKKMFAARQPEGRKAFARFKKENAFWLEDYALFKVIKEITRYAGWESWPEPLKNRETAALENIRGNHAEELEFHVWLQWQLFLQFQEAAGILRKKDLHLMGDLPFLASRDSADVWSHPGYFKLHLSSGAPPDFYFAGGQEWGMPPYDWEAMARNGYDLLIEKLKYAQNFYDCFRIDHFVGFFRVWTFPREGPEEERRQRGAFDPPDESQWEHHGERLLNVILSATSMLPCAEDLGTVPDCSFRVLERYALPGMEVQRWSRDWKGTGDFKTPEQYRLNSLVTLSTHDTSPFKVWWEKETTAEERKKFWRFLGWEGKAPETFSKKILVRALEGAGLSRSIFSVQLFQDWLALSESAGKGLEDKRINQPGIVHEKNWRLRLPYYLEDLKKSTLHKKILEINKATGR